MPEAEVEPLSTDGAADHEGTLYEGLDTEGDEQPEGEAPPESEMFTVKIDGVESQVSREEAIAGYQRQADYTAKTQAVAAQKAELEQAQRLYSALESDPERTLRALVAAYGIDGTSGPESFEESETPDPTAALAARLDQFEASQREAQIAQEIEGSLVTLHTAHGEFDDNALIAFAIEKSIPDLTVAHAAYSYMSDSEKRSRSDAAALAAKGALPPVAGGHGVQGGSVVDGAAQGPPQTVIEAFESAARQLGRDDLVGHANS